MVIMGIDPGLANTGIVVIKDKKILYKGIVKTSAKLPIQNRNTIIVESISIALKEYKVEHVVCESFDHQPWRDKPIRGGANMGKLISAISWAVDAYGATFVLQPPKEAKMAFSDDDLVSMNEGKPVSPVHARDALRHALLYRHKKKRAKITKGT